MFRFLHAADIHLDSPLKGLSQYEGAPVEQLRGATRRALAALVALAIDEAVRFVIIAGDLYDGDWPDYNTGLFFNRQMMRLKEAGIPAFVIAGNHDAANKMTRTLQLPDNVTLFPHARADTRVLEDVGVALHGQSFAGQAVTEDLSQAYPAARPGLFNIGVLHTSATGRTGHETYAPCTPAGLQAKGYDYWALGHIHTREVLQQTPPIVFPGNIQGRHVGETGPKGCYLCTVDDQRRVTLAFRAVDVVRWELAEIDVGGLATRDEVQQAVVRGLRGCRDQADGRLLAVRVVFRGTTPLHQELAAQRGRLTNEVRSWAEEAGGDIWIEKVQIRTTAPRSARRDAADGDDPLSELREILAELRRDPEQWSACGIGFDDLRNKLPDELGHLLPVDDPEWRASVLEEAEALLHQKFAEGSEA